MIQATLGGYTLAWWEQRIVDLRENNKYFMSLATERALEIDRLYAKASVAAKDAAFTLAAARANNAHALGQTSNPADRKEIVRLRTACSKKLSANVTLREKSEAKSRALVVAREALAKMSWDVTSLHVIRSELEARIRVLERDDHPRVTASEARIRVIESDLSVAKSSLRVAREALDKMMKDVCHMRVERNAAREALRRINPEVLEARIRVLESDLNHEKEDHRLTKLRAGILSKVKDVAIKKQDDLRTTLMVRSRRLDSAERRLTGLQRALELSRQARHSDCGAVPYRGSMVATPGSCDRLVSALAEVKLLRKREKHMRDVVLKNQDEWIDYWVEKWGAKGKALKTETAHLIERTSERDKARVDLKDMTKRHSFVCNAMDTERRVCIGQRNQIDNLQRDLKDMTATTDEIRETLMIERRAAVTRKAKRFMALYGVDPYRIAGIDQYGNRCTEIIRRV